MVVIHAGGAGMNIFPVLFFVICCKSLPLHPRKLFGFKYWNEMANHKATKKDMRQAAKRRERNKYYGKTTRNAIRDLKAIKTGAEATKEFPDVASMIDKLAKRGIIHKNKAANLKSKLAKKVNTLAK
jgi:small subunit ribosomal protein S20